MIFNSLVQTKGNINGVLTMDLCSLSLFVMCNLFYEISSNEENMDKKHVYNKIKDKFLWVDPRVEKVVKKYDRADFLPFYKTDDIYKDKYIYLGCGAELSSPFVHSEALHLLRNHLKPGAHVLELGSGTGYLATCMAEMVQPNGSVIGLDLVSALVDFSIKTTIRVAPHLIEPNILKFVVGDGRYGYRYCQPYDLIYTDCSHRSIPSVLVDQLKPGGRLVMTLGRTELPQYLIVVDKDHEGKASLARVRIRSKVPRLCANIKEQDLYYQRMYPLKHSQYIPNTATEGQYRDYKPIPTRKSNKINKFQSEDVEHFALAERRYQEKIDQLDRNYDEEDAIVAEFGRTTIKITEQRGSNENTEPILQYEDWAGEL